MKRFLSKLWSLANSDEPLTARQVVVGLAVAFIIMLVGCVVVLGIAYGGWTQ